MNSDLTKIASAMHRLAMARGIDSELLEFAEQLRALPSPAKGEPSDWKLMPPQATPEMLEAAYQHANTQEEKYMAMFDAAPVPAKGAEPEWTSEKMALAELAPSLTMWKRMPNPTAPEKAMIEMLERLQTVFAAAPVPKAAPAVMDLGKVREALELAQTAINLLARKAFSTSTGPALNLIAKALALLDSVAPDGAEPMAASDKAVKAIQELEMKGFTFESDGEWHWRLNRG